MLILSFFSHFAEIHNTIHWFFLYICGSQESTTVWYFYLFLSFLSFVLFHFFYVFYFWVILPFVWRRDTFV